MAELDADPGRRAGRRRGRSGGTPRPTRRRCCSPRPGRGGGCGSAAPHDPDTLHLRVGLTDRPGRRSSSWPEKGAPRDAELPPAPAARSVPGPAAAARAGRDRPGRAAGRAPAGWPAGWSRRPRRCTARATCRSWCWPPTRQAGRHWNWVRWLPHCAPRRARTASRWSARTRTRRRGGWPSWPPRSTERLEKAREHARRQPGLGEAARRPADPTWGRRSWSCWTGRGCCAASPACRRCWPPRRQAGVYAICLDESAAGAARGVRRRRLLGSRAGPAACTCAAAAWSCSARCSPTRSAWPGRTGWPGRWPRSGREPGRRRRRRSRPRPGCST